MVLLSIHHQNIRQLETEMFKTLNGVITEFIKIIFKLRAKYLTNKQKGVNFISLP